MSAESPLSLSELVYLFVDGETTSAQEQMLFQHLATDVDLQAELQEAILIRSTLEQDCSALAVPPETTAAIFSKAGFALPGTTVGWSVSNFIGAAVHGVKSIALPALFAIGGAALTSLYFITQLHPDPQESALLSLQNRLSAQTTESAVLISQTDNTEDSTPLDLRSFAEKTDMPFQQKHNAFSYERNESRKTVQESQQNNMSLSNNSVLSQTIIESASTVAQYTPLAFSSFPTTDNVTMVPMANHAFTEYNEKKRWSISTRGLMNLTTMPVKNQSVSEEHLSDFAVSLGYALNEQTFIGIEAGRQSLRYYTFENGKGDNATLHTSMEWAGAYLRKQFDNIGFGEFTPFAQVHLGGTLSGPSGRLITGLQWQPDSRISLSAGIEGSAFLYQNSGTWYSMRTLGLTYQVDVHF